jgi:hypothetical protein
MELLATQYLDLQTSLAATGSSSIASTALGDASVHLFNANIDITKDTTLAELLAIEADYQGYGAESITWNPPNVSSDGAVEVIGDVGQFRATGSDSPNGIWGLWVENGDSSLCLVGKFDSPPIPIVDTLSLLEVTLRYRPTNGGRSRCSARNSRSADVGRHRTMRSFGGVCCCRRAI